MLYKLLLESPLGSAIEAEDHMKVVPVDIVCIYTNIVVPEKFNDTQVRLLDILRISSAAYASGADLIEPANTHYKTVDVDVLDEIEIFIATSLGVPVPFRNGPAYLQLHFKRV
jgi:hypothetical protein